MKPLVLTMGEPAGIGGELTLKAWYNRKNQNLPVFFAVDNVERLTTEADYLGFDIPIQSIDHPSEAHHVFETALPVFSIDLPQTSSPGILNTANGKATVESIKKSVSFCLAGEAAAVVTNPINKAALYEVGFSYPGHTEFIASLCGDQIIPVMMLAGDDLRVVPLTIHIPISKVSKTITKEMIVENASIIIQALHIDFGIQEPHLAIAGLNPHAGEGGTIGLEEQDIIIPAIEMLKNQGLHVSGPYSADAMFHAHARSGYDAALCMYHDQALIPLKTLDFYGGVNITLGLPIVRTSPDHGTALGIAGQGLARAESFINAIKTADQIAQKRLA